MTDKKKKLKTYSIPKRPKPVPKPKPKPVPKPKPKPKPAPKPTWTKAQKIAYNRYSGKMALKGKPPAPRNKWLALQKKKK